MKSSEIDANTAESKCCCKTVAARQSEVAIVLEDLQSTAVSQCQSSRKAKRLPEQLVQKLSERKMVQTANKNALMSWPNLQLESHSAYAHNDLI